MHFYQLGNTHKYKLKLFCLLCALLSVYNLQAQFSCKVEGVVKQNGKYLSGAIATLTDNSGGSKEVVTGPTGTFSFSLDPNEEYNLYITKPGCIKAEVVFSTMGFTDEEAQTFKNIVKPEITLFELPQDEQVLAKVNDVLATPLKSYYYSAEKKSLITDEMLDQAMQKDFAKVKKIAEESPKVVVKDEALVNYQNAIAKGDKAFIDKDYPTAKKSYEEALTYKASESYPKNKLNEINKVTLQEKETADAREKKRLEQEALAKASEEKRLSKEKELADAKEKQRLEQEALAKTAEDKRLIQEKALADAKEKQRLEQEALAKTSEEKRLAQEKQLSEQKALADAKEKERLEKEALAKEEEDKKLADAKEKQRLEQEAIAKAAEEKRLADEKQLSEQKALADAKEKERLEKEALAKAEEDKKLADVKEKQRLEQEAIAKAAEEKRLAQEKEIADAKEKQRLEQEALAKAEENKRIAKEKEFAEAKEKERLAQKKAIAEAAEKKRLEEEAAATLLENTYTASITTADSAFQVKSFIFAKAAYLKALELKSAESYPKDRIAEIDSLLATVYKNDLSKKYPQGVTEEIVKENNDKVTKRIVVEGNKGYLYIKKETGFGQTYYFKDGTPITEQEFNRVTQPR